MNKIIYTITLGFLCGIFTFYSFSYINNPYGENDNNSRLCKNSSIDGAVFFSNTQKNINEDEGEGFIASPLVEEFDIEDGIQNV